MSDFPSIEVSEAEPARGVRSLGKFLQRYGAMIALLSTPLQVGAGYYLKTTFQTKAEAKEDADKQDAKIEANKQLVYERTRPLNDRMGALEGHLNTIDTKIDGEAKIADERAKHQAEDSADVKHSLHQIEELLMRAPAH